MLEQDIVWLHQEQMAELFGRDCSVIARHIGNVFKEGELEEKSNVRNLYILLPITKTIGRSLSN
ncbi:hypothetical protein [Comamonas kerstersii]|uniref:hypothetical protein n=1 Tax=Comamonas kerstersii TaxID=225992 RepID=UPI00345DA825